MTTHHVKCLLCEIKITGGDNRKCTVWLQEGRCMSLLQGAPSLAVVIHSQGLEVPHLRGNSLSHLCKPQSLTSLSLPSHSPVTIAMLCTVS